MAIHTLKRRGGTWYRYSLTYLDSATVALLETADHEPTRKLAVADVANLDELQDLCDDWNKTNHREAQRLCGYIGPEYT